MSTNSNMYFGTKKQYRDIKELKEQLAQQKALLDEAVKVIEFLVKQDEIPDSRNYVWCTEVAFAESIRRARSFLEKVNNEQK